MKSLFHLFRKFVVTVVNIQEIIGTVLLAVFFVAILIQIAARYAGVAILWTEDVANYSFIWAVFMGASAMLYHRAHFSFTFFKERFKGRTAAAYNIFLSLIMLCFTVPMMYYGREIVDTFWDYNWISIPEMKMGPTWMCVPIMGATMTLYTIYHIVLDLRGAAALKEGGQAQ